MSKKQHCVIRSRGGVTGGAGHHQSLTGHPWCLTESKGGVCILMIINEGDLNQHHCKKIKILINYYY